MRIFGGWCVSLIEVPAGCPCQLGSWSQGRNDIQEQPDTANAQHRLSQNGHSSGQGDQIDEQTGNKITLNKSQVRNVQKRQRSTGHRNCWYNPK